MTLRLQSPRWDTFKQGTQCESGFLLCCTSLGVCTHMRMHVHGANLTMKFIWMVAQKNLKIMIIFS